MCSNDNNHNSSTDADLYSNANTTDNDSTDTNNVSDISKVSESEAEKKQQQLNSTRRMAFGSPTWTSKDDSMLRYLKEVEKLGWRDISMYFPTRTINACQFRWRRLIMKKENKIKRDAHKAAIKERLLLKNNFDNLDDAIDDRIKAVCKVEHILSPEI